MAKTTSDFNSDRTIRQYARGLLLESPIVLSSTERWAVRAKINYSNTTVYYGIHEGSECIPIDSGVTNLIHDRRSCVDFTLEVEANGLMCPLKREQARRETQQWVMRRLPTADSIVEIGRKSRS